jgi:hypothetical protein
MRITPVTAAFLLKCPDESTAAYTSYPSAVAASAGKVKQTSVAIPPMISFFLLVASTARLTRGSSQALSVVRSMISTSLSLIKT